MYDVLVKDCREHREVNEQACVFALCECANYLKKAERHNDCDD